MVTINLLPWREKQARYERRVLIYAMFGALLFAMLVLWCVDRYLSGQQDEFARRAENLTKEINWRVGLVSDAQSLQSAFPNDHAIDFFRRLNESGAQTVCFEQIKKTKSGVELMGYADSSEQLTVFLRTSPLTTYFGELKVNQLQQTGERLKFNLLGKTHAV